MTRYIQTLSQTNGLKTSEFLTDFNNFVEHISNLSSTTVIVGDFNMHVDIPSKSEVSHFLTTVENAGFHQFGNKPTHIGGHTLDLLVMRPEENLAICSDVDLRLGSDHNIVCFNINQQKPKLQKIKVTSRELASVDLETFQADLNQSFASTEQFNNVDDLIASFDDAVRLTLDKHVPVKSSTRSSRARYP